MSLVQTAEPIRVTFTDWLAQAQARMQTPRHRRGKRMRYRHPKELSIPYRRRCEHLRQCAAAPTKVPTRPTPQTVKTLQQHPLFHYHHHTLLPHTT